MEISRPSSLSAVLSAPFADHGRVSWRRSQSSRRQSIDLAYVTPRGGAMLKIEELFDISVDHVEVAEVATISDARKLLVDKLSSAPAPHQ